MSQSQLPPSIFDFNDPIDFLKAYFDYLKIRTPDLSVRKWSIRLGISSPEILMLIFKNKKRISLTLIPTITNSLKMSAEETQYFDLLVKHSKSINDEEKNLYAQKMAEMRAQQKMHFHTVKNLDIFSNWIYSAILEFCNLKQEVCTEKTIIDSFKIKVAPEIIEEAIEHLLDQQLLSRDEKGNLSKIPFHIISKNDIPVKSVHNYYRQTAELAKEACDIDLNEREFQCMTISLSHSDIPAYKEAIREFRKKITAMKLTHKPDQVFQLNVQFFPLTKGIAEMSPQNIIAENTLTQ